MSLFSGDAAYWRAPIRQHADDFYFTVYPRKVKNMNHSAPSYPKFYCENLHTGPTPKANVVTDDRLLCRACAVAENKAASVRELVRELAKEPLETARREFTFTSKSLDSSPTQEKAASATTARRSKFGPPYNEIPTDVLHLVAERFGLGAIKYSRFNWKRGVGDVEYVRQFDTHLMEHRKALFELATWHKNHTGNLTLGPAMTWGRTIQRWLKKDSEGDTMIDCAIAMVWNTIALAWYMLNDFDTVCAAFNEVPPDAKV